jgi:hypothetical protein
MQGKMVHGQRRDYKWHPYTSCIEGIWGNIVVEPHGVGVPFIIPPLPTSPVAGTNEDQRCHISLIVQGLRLFHQISLFT